ncbi:MAG TPA: FIST N-terminal domain-containing protein [Nitrospiria bacterium]|nr:FIST N-terminal domain-containing protein [Nitrospiria bacterium]
MTTYGTGTSIHQETAIAAREACVQAASSLQRPVDLAFVFVSSHHADRFEEAAAIVAEHLAPRVVLGCTGEGIIGLDQEIELQPALSVWAAGLPGVTLSPFHATFDQGEDGIRVSGWPENMAQGSPSLFLLLADPFSTPGTEFLAFLDHHYPGAKAVGGMSSGGRAPGENRLLIGETVAAEGVVGVALSGDLPITTVVSQGCRPVGGRFLITRSEGNVIYELGGRPAFACLQDMYAALSPAEQELARRGLHLGLTINEAKSQFERGDFLVRGLVGADQQEGSVAVGDMVREGQTVQFHIRDRDSASEDLNTLLAAQARRIQGPAPEAALLFSCNGRGRRLFGRAHHDVTLVRALLGKIPVAGFFAQGEIGPVGGSNFLHGFTASIAIFGGGSDG